MSSSGFEIKNTSIQGMGRARRIEIFAKECDLPSGGSQKQHIVLTVNAPSRLDESLCLDFADCRCRIGEGMHLEIEEAKVLDRAEKPAHVAYHLLPSREPRRMAQRGRKGQLPQQVIGDQRLPLPVLRDERLEMALQKVGCSHRRSLRGESLKRFHSSFM